MGGDAEVGFEPGDFGLRRLHQALGLDDVEPGGGAGFQLELGELVGFLARPQVVLRQREALLEEADVDIGGDEILQEGEPGDVGGGIGRIERGERAFLGAAELAEEIEQPGDIGVAGGGVFGADLRAQLAHLAR